jgi:signal transduction histidine kinase
VLLAALAILAFAPWVVTHQAHGSSDGFAIAIEQAGSLRFRLLAILIEVPKARVDPQARRRVEDHMTEQRLVLVQATQRDSPARRAACSTPQVCDRMKDHLQRWTKDLEPRLRQILDGSLELEKSSLVADGMVELEALDETVRAAANAIQARSEAHARAGIATSVGSMFLVALVAFGVWDVFSRIRRLRSAAERSDVEALGRENAKDEIGALAVALASGIEAEKRRRRAERERAEQLRHQQLATRRSAEALSAWISGARSLRSALEEVAHATGHEQARLVRDEGIPDGGPHSQRVGLSWGKRPLGILELIGPSTNQTASTEVLLDTLRQVVAIACLADQLLAEKTAHERLAVAMGGITGPGSSDFGESLRQILTYDCAIIEHLDASGRVEDVWEVHPDRLERIATSCESGVPSEILAVGAGSEGGCPTLRARAPGAQLAVPLAVSGTLLGGLFLARRERDFDGEDVEAAQALAPVIAGGLARIQLEARLRFAEQWSTLGAFGRLLAHEIKNPLNSMSLELQLLERRIAKIEVSDADRDKLAPSIRVVKNELARLIALSNDYLAFSPKPGALELVPVDIRAITHEVLRAHAASFTDHRISIVDRLGEEPVLVLGHAHKLKQLLHNLIGNAIEAVSAADVREIQLGLRRHGADVELAVRDSGPGISDPVMIFAPGYTTKASGTGMGLAICQQVAKQHGGRLAAKNRESGGAEFTLSLKAHPASPGADDARPIETRTMP